MANLHNLFLGKGALTEVLTLIWKSSVFYNEMDETGKL